MVLTVHGDAPRLILTVTRACNLRCGFCPLELGPWNMDADVAMKAVAIYQDRFPSHPHHVRMFGGEPLLRFDLLKRIIGAFPKGGRTGGAKFSFPTNGTMLKDDVVEFLREHPRVEAAVSRVQNAKVLASLGNVLINLCIPQEGAKDLAPYVGRLLAGGMTRLNFLPAFFVVWKQEEAEALKRSFKLTAELIRVWEDRGVSVEVRNISVFNPVPLYNHGMVVDIDGEVFPSNAVFCDDFKSERDNLRMGSVHKPAEIDWELPDRIDWAGIFKNGLDKDVYDSTMRVNDLLTEFVQNLARTRSGYAAVAVG